MEQIIIKVKDRKKAQTLLDFLRSVDYIESITEKEIPETASQDAESEEDFFSLAGLWAGRDLSLKSIREQAWPYRA